MMIFKILATSVLILIFPLTAQAAKWNPVTGEELTKLYQGTVFKGYRKNKKWTTYYCADGSGKIVMGGKESARTWAAKGTDQICTTSDGNTRCFKFYQNAKKSNKYRYSGEAGSGKFTLTDQKPDFCG